LLPPGTRLGAVHLAVTNADRALGLWRDVLGLSVLAPAPGDADTSTIRLGDATGRELIGLTPGASRGVPRGVTGLYHVALHFDSRREFARAIARLAAHGWPQAPTDHLVTETTYLSDPDGNGIELTFETPHRGVLFNDNGRYLARTPEGEVRSGRDPLDVEDVLSELGDGTGTTDRAALFGAPLHGLRIGHVHLHVRDLDESRAFYQDVIGFYGMMHMTAIGMSDFGVDTAVPHTLAINTWAGRGAPAPPAGVAGLRRVTLELPTADSLVDLTSRLSDAGVWFERTSGSLAAGAGIDVLDPSSNRLHIRPAPQA
ncbi:MAG: VOC family protein, partial [Planctomycetota bacterium]